MVQESTCNVGDLGLIPGLGRSPGEENGYPLQYSGLENSMDCIVHRVAKSRTWLSYQGMWNLSLYSNLFLFIMVNFCSLLQTGSELFLFKLILRNYNFFFPAVVNRLLFFVQQSFAREPTVPVTYGDMSGGWGGCGPLLPISSWQQSGYSWDVKFPRLYTLKTHKYYFWQPIRWTLYNHIKVYNHIAYK